MDMQEMGTGLPAWLTTVAWLWIAVAVVSALVIACDIGVRGRRQPQRVMELVWPLAALYLGPLAVPAYRRFGRTEDPVRHVLPGGVSSGLAHVVAVPLVVATGLTLAGLDMWAMVAIITVLATGLVFAFEYAFGAGRARRRSGGAGVRSVAAVALVTILAFDVGMLGWMVLLHVSENMPAAGDVRFTFLMQLGLVIGSLTAYPAMRWLASRSSRRPLAV